MSVTVIYREDGGVVLNAEGIVTGEERIEWNRTIYASDEKIAALKYQLCDFSRAENSKLAPTNCANRRI